MTNVTQCGGKQNEFFFPDQLHSLSLFQCTLFDITLINSPTTEIIFKTKTNFFNKIIKKISVPEDIKWFFFIKLFILSWFCLQYLKKITFYFMVHWSNIWIFLVLFFYIITTSYNYHLVIVVSISILILLISLLNLVYVFILN